MTETNTDAPTLAGVVKWYAPEKGYGFIVDSAGRDIFMHINEVSDACVDPIPGNRVTFKMGKSPNGKPAAVEIVVVG